MTPPFALLAWHWLAAGVTLAVLEILLPGNVLIWLGIAAGCVGGIMLALPDLSLVAQLAIFAVAAVASLGLGFGWRRQRSQQAAVNIGSARLIGQTGILETAIIAGRGEMRLGDGYWPVSGPDLPAGTAVIITASDGVMLTVAPKP